MAAGALLAMAGAAWADPARALSFNLICSADPTCASFNPSAYAGFQTAAARWSALFSDPFTLNLQIGFSALAQNVLGNATFNLNFTSYSGYRAALGLDRLSSDDYQAYSSLGSGSSFDLLINLTADNPNGVGSITPYLDNNGGVNNSTVALSTANVKALGGIPAYLPANTNQIDASITFSNAFSWDFDPSNGITAGSVDFIGVAAHEIGHALGFVSGVDTLERNSPNNTVNPPVFYNADVFGYVAPLDLYRYSAQSLATGGGVIDWTADTRDKYLSFDRGVTNLGGFSTGGIHGDGWEASHWKDNLALGLMDPTLASGELGVISALDVRGLDAIGYDLASITSAASRVPAPLPLFGAAAAHVWSRRLRRRIAAGRSAAGRARRP